MKSPMVRSPNPSNLRLTGSPDEHRSNASVSNSCVLDPRLQNWKNCSWDRSAYSPTRTKQHPNAIAQTAISKAARSVIAAITLPWRCAKPQLASRS